MLVNPCCCEGGCIAPFCLEYVEPFPGEEIFHCGICMDDGATVTFDGSVPDGFIPQVGQVFLKDCFSDGGFWWKIKWDPQEPTCHISIEQYSASPCDAGDLIEACCGSSANWSNLTCDPFSVTIAMSSGIGGCFGGTLTQAILETTADAQSCGHCFAIRGCNDSLLEGATIDIWDDATKTVPRGSCTTDADGECCVMGFNTQGYAEISFPGLVTFSGTIIVGVTTETLVVDSSTHVCTTLCAVPGDAGPVAKTLTCTFTIAGAKTLTWGGSSWSVSFSASGQSYVLTIFPDATMTLTRGGVSCGASLTVNSCPSPGPLVMTVSIPAGNCQTELGVSGTVTE